MQVKIKPEYIDRKAYRQLPGTIVGSEWNEYYNYYDLIILFPTGNIEPFGSHELTLNSETSWAL